MKSTSIVRVYVVRLQERTETGLLKITTPVFMSRDRDEAYAQKRLIARTVNEPDTLNVTKVRMFYHDYMDNLRTNCHLRGVQTPGGW